MPMPRVPPLDLYAKRLAVDLLRGVPVSVWERIAPKDLITFTYHLVSDEEVPHQRLYAYKNRGQFESDVVYARERAVTYDEVVRHRRRTARLPPNRILFTFDDGLSECFSVIRPILRKHGVKAIFFVNTQFLDDKESFFETTLSRCLGEIEKLDEATVVALLAELGINRVSSSRPISSIELGRSRLLEARVGAPSSRAHTRLMLWLLGFEEDGKAEIDRAWSLLRRPQPGGSRAGQPTCMTTDQVKQLASEGFTVGSHGSTHLPMQQFSPQEMEAHIVSSCETVRSMTGQARVPFAFPYTGRGIDRGILAAILRRNPFIDLLFDTQDFSRDEDFVVQRIGADRPPSSAADHVTNLPFLMRTAWSRRSSWYRSCP